MATKTGKIIQIIGPVIDVDFGEETGLPPIYNALTVKLGKGEIVAECGGRHGIPPQTPPAVPSAFSLAFLGSSWVKANGARAVATRARSRRSGFEPTFWKNSRILDRSPSLATILACLQSSRKFFTGSNRLDATSPNAALLSFKACFSSMSLFLIS